MTPEELDIKLRTLSEGEKRYKAGEPAPKPPYRADVVNGQVVLYSEMGSRINDYVKNLAREQTPHKGIPVEILPASPYFFITHHARFREYPLHRHNFVELVYVYDGSCTQIVNGTVIKLRKGQVLLLDSGAMHTIMPTGENDILVNIQIDKRYFDHAFFARLDLDNVLTSFFARSAAKGMQHDSYLRFNSSQDRRLRTFIVEFMCEWFDPSNRSEHILSDLFSLIVSELVLCYGNNTPDSQFEFHRSNEIVRILRYIEREYATCTLESCGAEFGMSPGYLSKTLKSQTGKTFRQLLLQQRMTIAKLLLSEGNLPVTEVARSVGYENVSFFYRIFERECGVKPGEWRERSSS